MTKILPFPTMKDQQEVNDSHRSQATHEYHWSTWRLKQHLASWPYFQEHHSNIVEYAYTQQKPSHKATGLAHQANHFRLKSLFNCYSEYQNKQNLW
jgi:hypothetical protein